MMPITLPEEKPQPAAKGLLQTVGDTLLRCAAVGVAAGAVLGAGFGGLAFLGPGASSVVSGALGVFTGAAPLSAVGLTAMGGAVGSALGLVLSVPAGITKGVMNHKVEKTKAMMPVVAKEAMMRGINIGQQIGPMLEKEADAALAEGKHVAALNEKRAKQIDLASAQPMGRA